MHRDAIYIVDHYIACPTAMYPLTIDMTRGVFAYRETGSATLPDDVRAALFRITGGQDDIHPGEVAQALIADVSLDIDRVTSFVPDVDYPIIVVDLIHSTVGFGIADDIADPATWVDVVPLNAYVDQARAEWPRASDLIDIDL